MTKKKIKKIKKDKPGDHLKISGSFIDVINAAVKPKDDKQKGSK